MRLAPVPLFFARDPEEAVRMSGESSLTTHGTVACVDACRYFGGLVVGALQGSTKGALLSPRYSPVAGLWEREPLCPEIDEVAEGSFLRREPPEIVGSGYVVKSLEAALWAFHNSESFKEGCLLAVNLGTMRTPPPPSTPSWPALTTASTGYRRNGGPPSPWESLSPGWPTGFGKRAGNSGFRHDIPNGPHRRGSTSTEMDEKHIRVGCPAQAGIDRSAGKADKASPGSPGSAKQTTRLSTWKPNWGFWSITAFART